MPESTDFLKQEQPSKPAVIVTRRVGVDQGDISQPEASVAPLELGKRVREIRLSQQLTLEEASRKTGLARSTLSKIENEQISPTFTAVTKLVNGLGIDIPQLFSPVKKTVSAGGRRDITRQGEGRLHPTRTYEHELLATELSGKKMIPYRTTVRARSFDEYREWVRHDGEEFLLVLHGSIELYTEYYQPVELFEGDSAYYDAQMGHALVSTSGDDAVILWVTA
ncbi:helix-turn-helix domain-containing protein [Endozoicomonas sp. YOMI1]|uniref:helix-turn-helix domain-containing protein n=1 Tax=Endozoicomonas sp. YOMI1 TaxID=2828739 RepID=UPI0021492BC5|nr:XRE family transcriptional regulator [Endozoicomonas sp. YOMI1]